MQKYIDEISLHLNDELKKIEEEEINQIVKTEKSINCISQCLSQLKEYICNNPFQSKEEEIYFFKHTKPSIYFNLIYFAEVFRIESRCPLGSKNCKKKYLLKFLKKHRMFFKENIDFYTYYRSQSTHLDEKYFLRENMDFRLNLDDVVFIADPAFSTSHDYKVAKIMAIEKLNTYINHELQKLKKVGEHTADDCQKKKYDWTDPKIAMTELIYALFANGSINNGSVDIKEIVQLFESIFNIDLGDFYRTFLEIKTRQNPTKFLDALRASLSRKIEEKDE